MLKSTVQAAEVQRVTRQAAAQEGPFVSPVSRRVSTCGRREMWMLVYIPSGKLT